MQLGGVAMDDANEVVARAQAPTLEEVLAADAHAPILLLRSFHDDCLQMESLEVEFKNSQTITFEELVCRCVGLWGPVIAFGNPSEKLPPLGAARGYH